MAIEREIVVESGYVFVRYPRRMAAQEAWRHLQRHPPPEAIGRLRPAKTVVLANNRWSRCHEATSWRWKARLATRECTHG